MIDPLARLTPQTVLATFDAQYLWPIQGAATMTDGQIIVTALFFVFGILLVLFQHDSMFGATLIGIVIGRVLR